MTGFALFQDGSKIDSFQCFDCDLNFTCAKTAATHIRDYHIFDDEDEDEEIDQNDENNEDEYFTLEECIDPFETMHKWMDPKSIFSCEYENWIKAFGQAECPFCSSVFGSKIAWIYHIIASHGIQPDKNYLCDAKTLVSTDCKKVITGFRTLKLLVSV